MKTKQLVVVTGAAQSGYGSAVLRRLVIDGYAVLGSHEPSERTNAEQLKKEIGDAVSFVEIDHGNRLSLDKLVLAVPHGEKLHGLVNAQFFFNMEDPENFDFSLWDRSLAVNLTAPQYLYHQLRQCFSENGSIVTVTSTEGFIGSFGASAYAATKAAIHNLTKSWAIIIGPRGVRVNAVAAGWIGGVMDTDEVFNMSRSITPLKRLGTPEEIAAVVSFLLSYESRFVNGTVLVADGGYTGVDTIAKYEFDSAQKK